MVFDVTHSLTDTYDYWPKIKPVPNTASRTGFRARARASKAGRTGPRDAMGSHETTVGKSAAGCFVFSGQGLQRKVCFNRDPTPKPREVKKATAKNKQQNLL